MRILSIITRNELRGAEVVAGQLAEGLRDRDCTVTIAALYRNNDRQRLSLSERVPIVELDGRRQGRLEGRMLVRLAKLVSSFRPDVIQANAFHAAKSSVLLKRLGIVRCPIVYRNVSVAGGWVQNELQRNWGRWIFRGVSRVVSVSSASASDMCKTYGVPPRRVNVIRRGVAIPEIDSGAARRNLQEILGHSLGGPVLMHVGGFTPEKNHQGLLEAFRRIQSDQPNVRLVLIGDGPLRDEVTKRVQETGLSESVHLLGARADARDLLSAAELLLLPSRIEGLPGVVLEAAAAGVPAVCADVGAVQEVVKDGITGAVVPAGDDAAMAMAMATLRLLKDRPLRRRMGRAACEFVSANHTLHGMTSDFLAVFNAAIEEQEPAACRIDGLPLCETTPRSMGR